MAPPNYKWIIEGHDGANGKILTTVVSGNFGEPRITEILRCLASRALTADEVVQDLTQPSRGRLHVHVDRRAGQLMTVGSPFFAARRVKG